MKKAVLIISIMLLFFVCAVPGYCYDLERESGNFLDFSSGEIDRDDISCDDDTPVEKLERGVINMTTFWMEIPAEVAKVSKEQDPAAGLTSGLVNGVAISLVRVISGIYDTVTFPFSPYDKPVMRPEYPWSAADEKIKAWLW